MPKVTLTSSGIAYNLYTLLNAVDANIPKSCRGLSIQVPAATDEAANAGAVVKIGPGNQNTAPTDVTSPEKVLREADEYSFPVSDVNNISLMERHVKASVNNAVLYVTVQVA